MKRSTFVMVLAAATAVGGLVWAAESGQNPLVGKAAPEIDAKYWINSEPLTLKGLQGKVVVVEFWATWCPPCRKSIPHLIELNKKFAGKGVVVVSLTNETKEKVEPFVKEMKMDYAVGGGSQTAGAYGVKGIPTAFVVDAAGVVAWAGHPMDPEFEKAIEAQAAKVAPKK